MEGADDLVDEDCVVRGTSGAWDQDVSNVFSHSRLGVELMLTLDRCMSLEEEVPLREMSDSSIHDRPCVGSLVIYILGVESRLVPLDGHDERDVRALRVLAIVSLRTASRSDIAKFMFDDLAELALRYSVSEDDDVLGQTLAVVCLP